MMRSMAGKLCFGIFIDVYPLKFPLPGGANVMYGRWGKILRICGGSSSSCSFCLEVGSCCRWSWPRNICIQCTDWTTMIEAMCAREFITNLTLLTCLLISLLLLLLLHLCTWVSWVDRRNQLPTIIVIIITSYYYSTHPYSPYVQDVVLWLLLSKEIDVIEYHQWQPRHTKNQEEHTPICSFCSDFNCNL